jgi:ABC-2 type transport system permease protein
MNTRSVLAIAWKDILDGLKNYRLLAVVLMPVIFSLLYSFLFRDTPTEITIVVHDAGRSALVGAMRTNGATVVSAPSEATLAQEMEAQKAAIGLSLPPDFDERLAAGEHPPLTMIVNAEQTMATASRLLVLRTIESQAQQAGQPPPVALVERPLESPAQERASATFGFMRGLGLQQFFLILWTILSLSMTGLYTVPTFLVEEKERKTLSAILIAPASYTDVIVGKALVGLVYGMAGVLVIFALNQGFTGMVGLSLLFALLSSLVLTLVGLALGGLFDNTGALNSWASLAFLPFLLPVMVIGTSGDSPLLTLMQIIPTYHTARGLGMSLSGTATPGEAAGSLIALVLSTLVAFGLVWASLKRQER